MASSNPAECTAPFRSSRRVGETSDRVARDRLTASQLNAWEVASWLGANPCDSRCDRQTRRGALLALACDVGALGWSVDVLLASQSRTFAPWSRRSGRKSLAANSTDSPFNTRLQRRALRVDVETIAIGRAIRDLPRLRKRYGVGRWRKLKGAARVRLQGGRTRRAELHWYEAHGVGRVRMKIKRFID